MRMIRRIGLLGSSLFVFCVFGSVGLPGYAADPCKSGLPEGKKPGPYSAVVVTGPERGQSYCYICETGDKPAVIIFARTLGDPLGKLVRRLDKALTEYKKADLRGWVTFLTKDTSRFEDKVAAWGKEHAISTMPLAVFTDAVGPPSYRLARGADVTVLLFVKRKVVANFAFRPGELTDARATEVLKALPKIVGEKR
jgi:hypothetical protein